MKEWRQLGSTEMIHGGWRKVYRKSYAMSNGETFIAEVSDSEDAQGTAVIALTKDKKVVIAQQFRPGPGMIMNELPGGAVDPGEDPLEAAKRELREETGYVPAKVTPLGKIYKHAWMHTSWQYFLMEDCELSPEGQHLEYGEEIDVVLLSIDELIQSAKDGKMTDTEAVFLAYDHLKQLAKEK